MIMMIIIIIIIIIFIIIVTSFVSLRFGITVYFLQRFPGICL
jgi:hypothetical protein